MNPDDEDAALAHQQELESQELSMNVYKKLNAARSEFHKLKLEKTGHNKFAGYKYFELGDFLTPALGIFEKHGLCAFVSFDTEFARMTILDADKPDDQIVITSPFGSASLKGAHEIQNIGAVETYQRRYLWVAALEIVEHDALDASEGSKSKPKTITPTSGTLESLSDADRKKAIELAEAIDSAFLDRGDYSAYEEWVTIEGEPEFKTAVWRQLDSKIRSAIKKQAEAAKESK